MKKIFVVVSFLSLLCLQTAIAQNSTGNEMEADSAAFKMIQRHLIYPDAAYPQKESSIVFAKVYFKGANHIDTIVTSGTSVFAESVRHAIRASEGKWLHLIRNNKAPILIPFIFLFDNDSSLRDITLNVKYFAELGHFLQWQQSFFEPCILTKPIIGIGFKPQT